MSAIARELGISKSMVFRALKVYRETGSLEQPIRKTRAKKTTHIEDRSIVRLSKRNPFLTSREILQRLQPNIQETISSVTVRRRLLQAGLRGCIAKPKPLVSKKNIKARLTFARQHLEKPLAFWKRILWSDESKFNLFGSDGKKYVRRPPNREYDPRFTVKTVKHGGGSIMVWGAFSWHGIGPLVRIRGIMDQHVYKNIMANTMIPFVDENMPVTCVFQHDNDPKHTSRMVKAYLLESSVAVLDWPAQSPDLNPIENLWGHVQRELDGIPNSSADVLFQNIQNIWSNISTDRIRRLVESMPRRCRAVIENKGYPTQY